ncbi:MAG TPA: adenylate/guanylate cyclase domain-containing protein [Thermoleophilaceae bacterium]
MAAAGRALIAGASGQTGRLVAWVSLLALPLLGFVLLLAAPSTDLHWEDHPAHFWLVLGAAVVSAGLALSTSSIALRRADARLYLVSLAFLAAAGFLMLHALATPGVLLEGRTEGFVIATPVGLLIASLFAGASALPLDRRRAAAVIRHARTLRAALVALMALWAFASLTSLPGLEDTTPTERATGPLLVLAAIAVVLYGFAAVRYLSMQRLTGSPILLAVASACALLAEAMIAVAFARNWHATWWEWHLLMLAAFGAIAYSAQQEDREERFSDLYLDETAAGKREVSVLFADLQGFTAFSEGRDPREVSEMLNAYFEVAIPPLVREQDGEIDRLMGDAIMATWGTRGDQPDHAQRAVRAALALQATTAEIAGAHPAWPRFRAGVNSGEAMVGIVGAESGRSFTVIGDMVNVAARLEHEAPAGGVVIGAATLQALEGAHVRPLGAVRVKGKHDAVEAYLLEQV